MKKNSKISVALHSLIHLVHAESPATSEQLAECMGTNAVVVRRILGELKKRGLVESGKGHGGGWAIVKPPEKITLYDVYHALNERLLPTAPQVDKKEPCQIVHALAETMEEFLAEASVLFDSKLKRISLQDMLTKSLRGKAIK